MKKLTITFAVIAALVLTSCAGFPASATSSGPRTLVIDGETITEDEVGGFISWACKDYINGGRTLVEVGYFGDPDLEGLGFILYDGGYSGEYTKYYRDGLDLRWDWGSDSGGYSFVIDPDGKGYYFDFSTAKKGETLTQTVGYNCYQRY